MGVRGHAAFAVRPRVEDEMEDPGEPRGLARSDAAADGHLDRRYRRDAVEAPRVDFFPEIDEKLPVSRQFPVPPIKDRFHVVQRMGIATHQQGIELCLVGRQVGIVRH
jgi:hypothetical protein